MNDWIWLAGTSCTGALTGALGVFWHMHRIVKRTRSECEDDLENANRRHDDLASELQRANEDIELSRAHLEVLQSRCQRLTQEKQTIESLLDDAKAHSVHMQQRCSTLVSAHERLSQENRQLRMSCKSIKNAYQKSREIGDELRREYEVACERIESLRAEVDAAQKNARSAREELSNVNMRLAELFASKGPEIDFDSARSEIENLRLLVERTRRSAALARQEKVLVEQALRQALEKRNAQWREQVAARALALEVQAREHARTIDELETIRAQHEETSQQLAATQAMLDKMSHELTKTRATIETILLASHRSESESQRLREELASTQRAIDAARASSPKRWFLDEQRERLEQSLEASRRELVQTKSELEKARANLEHVHAHATVTQPSAVPTKPSEWATPAHPTSLRVDLAPDIADESDQQKRIADEFRLRVRLLEEQLAQRQRVADENLRLRLALAENEASLAANEIDRSELARLRAIELARSVAALAPPPLDDASVKDSDERQESPQQAISENSPQVPQKVREAAHALTDRIDEVLTEVLRREGSSSVVLADSHGLTVWGVARPGQSEASFDPLAALAAQAENLAACALDFLPLAAIREISLLDINDTMIRTRFLNADRDHLNLISLGPASSNRDHADGAISDLRHALFSRESETISAPLSTSP
jgi:predicted  nucleic acid-binding Zn-ribbon protein